MTRGRNASGHGSFRSSVPPQYSVAIPKYIGLRVKRYGPQITNAEVGLAGLGVVPARRNRYAALTARSTPPTRSPQPSRLWTTVGSSHKRIGRSRWGPYPGSNQPGSRRGGGKAQTAGAHVA